MAEKVLIYGKNTWPFTTAAREALAKQNREVEYIDVLADTEHLDKMLKYSDGRRKVPVIVDGDKVLIGFKGKSWGV